MRFVTHFIFLIIIFLSYEITAQGGKEKLTFEDYFKKHNIKAKSATNGIFYQIKNPGNSPKPKAGDYVKIHYKGMLLDGTVFDESERADPYVFQLGYRQVIRGWEMGLQLFEAGGKGLLFVPSELGYGERGIGNVAPHTDLVYEIELLEIMSPEAYDKYMRELEAKERRAFENKKKQQFLEDKKIIQQYAVENKLRTKRTTSGLSYVLKKKGKGELAQPGDYLEVHYEGRLMDGTVFDASFGKEPFKFVLGKGKAIEGWEEGLQFFKRGSEGWLLIPSQMAYGMRSIREGDIHIPENSVLIFKIKIVELKKGK